MPNLWLYHHHLYSFKDWAGIVISVACSISLFTAPMYSCRAHVEMYGAQSTHSNVNSFQTTCSRVSAWNVDDARSQTFQRYYHPRALLYRQIASTYVQQCAIPIQLWFWYYKTMITSIDQTCHGFVMKTTILVTSNEPLVPLNEQAHTSSR